MIRVRLFLPDEILSGGIELLEKWRLTNNSLVWVDLHENDKTFERELLEKEFQIHSLAIQDMQRERHPPKIEAFDTYTFILLKGLSPESIDIDFTTIQLAFVVGERFFISRHSGDSMSISRLESQLSDLNASKFDSSAKLATKLCRYVADRYLNILLALEPRLEELEEAMLKSPTDEMLAELIRYKSDLKRMRRYAMYHEQIFRTLKEKEHPHFDNFERGHEVIDVWEQQERIHSLSTLYYETASDLIDGYISVASHHLNQIMKFLTVTMAIFVPLSFLAGIYGMNFENMPELHSQSGYFILLSIMTIIAIGMLVVFRRLKWL